MGEKKNNIEQFKSLPKKGLTSFVDFIKRAGIEAEHLIRGLLTKTKRSKQEVKESIEYENTKQIKGMK